MKVHMGKKIDSGQHGWFADTEETVEGLLGLIGMRYTRAG